MFKAVINFLRVNNKRLVALALFSLIFYGSFFFMSYVVNPTQTIRSVTSQRNFSLNLLIFVIESVITHYILIFEVILPAMRKERSRAKVWAIGILFFLVKFAFNYYSFLVERSSTLSSSTVLPKNSVIWLLLMSYLYALVISFSAALLVDWVQKGKERILLEKQKTEAELSTLKHQINPHFLFNSLSFIYGKVIKQDKETADSVLMLANIMRYALGTSTGVDGTVNIMDELEHMKNVVEINQRRYNHELNICYEEQIDDQSIRIVPLVLITLVENAFKHGDLHASDHPLFIKVDTSMNEFLFVIRNRKGKGRKGLSNGVGLRNITQQLSLTYGERCRFVVEDDGMDFNVSLNISFPV